MPCGPSTLLYPNELRLGTGWWPPTRGSVVTVIFGQFWSIFSFTKSTCHMYCRSGWKKLGSRTYFNPLKKGVFLRAVTLFQNWAHQLTSSVWSLLMIKEAFPKLRGAPQFWKKLADKRRCIRQGNDKELLFQNWGTPLNSEKNDPPESKSDVIENGQQKRLIMMKDGDNFLEQKAWRYW